MGREKVKEFALCFLFLETAMIGAFVALEFGPAQARNRLFQHVLPKHASGSECSA